MPFLEQRTKSLEVVFHAMNESRKWELKMTEWDEKEWKAIEEEGERNGEGYEFTPASKANANTIRRPDLQQDPSSSSFIHPSAFPFPFNFPQ